MRRAARRRRRGCPRHGVLRRRRARRRAGVDDDLRGDTSRAWCALDVLGAPRRFRPPANSARELVEHANPLILRVEAPQAVQGGDDALPQGSTKRRPPFVARREAFAGVGAVPPKTPWDTRSRHTAVSCCPLSLSEGAVACGRRVLFSAQERRRPSARRSRRAPSKYVARATRSERPRKSKKDHPRHREMDTSRAPRYARAAGRPPPQSLAVDHLRAHRVQHARTRASPCARRPSRGRPDSPARRPSPSSLPAPRGVKRRRDREGHVHPPHLAEESGFRDRRQDLRARVVREGHDAQGHIFRDARIAHHPRRSRRAAAGQPISTCLRCCAAATAHWDPRRRPADKNRVQARCSRRVSQDRVALSYHLTPFSSSGSQLRSRSARVAHVPPPR